MAEVKRRKKRKLKRYRIVWPWKQTTKTQPKRKKRRRKLRFKKEVYFVLAGIVAILCLIFVPRQIESNNLKKLGYKKDEITAIREQNLANTSLASSCKPA